MSLITAWFDRRIIDVLSSEANQNWPGEALWTPFSGLSGTGRGVWIEPARSPGWGRSPTSIPRGFREFEADLQLAETGC
jgi:hypothetical protein